MSADDKIIIKRQYLEPIAEDKELKNIRQNTLRYATLMRSRKCTTCPNVATQMFCSDVDGAIFIKKYCDTCLKENKHLQSELMDNFDNLFIRKE